MMTTNRADYAAVPPDRGVESIDEQARRKGVRAIGTADDLAQEGVFDTDECAVERRARAAPDPSLDAAPDRVKLVDLGALTDTNTRSG
jgi:hypothetical protein